MLVKDYWRLAKLSLKARKKTTNNTILGVSISFIIILPLIFCSVGVYMSLLPQLNKNPQLLYAIFDSTNNDDSVKFDRDNWQIEFGNDNYFDYKNRKDDIEQADIDTVHYIMLNKSRNVEKIIEDYEFSYYDRIEFDGKKYPLGIPKIDLYEQNSRGIFQTSIAIIDSKDAEKIKSNRYNFFGDNFNKGFSANGKCQVLLSERYLEMAKLNANDVYGKKISIEIVENYDKTYIIDGLKTDLCQHYLLKDFEVVGVIGQNNLEKLDSLAINKDINLADIIITSASYYGENNQPAITNEYKIENNRILCVSNNFEEKNNLTSQYLFAGMADYTSYIVGIDNKNDVYSGKYELVEKNYYKFYPDIQKYNPYGQVTSATSKLQSTYDMPYLDYQSRVCSKGYYTFSVINFFLTIILGIMFIFALVLLVVVFVNLFNTIMHSVDTRRNYLGVMRAIGAKKDVIPKLYMFELLYIMAISFAWIASIGSLLCIGAKFLIEFLINQMFMFANLTITNLTITISWAVLPICVLIVLGIMLLVGLVYAVGCSWKVANNPIMKNLEEE